MKTNSSLPSELSAIQSILSKQKILYTRSEVIEKLGSRLLTFRELQYLHKFKIISDYELGFYMDVKNNSSFTAVQTEILKTIHLKLK